MGEVRGCDKWKMGTDGQLGPRWPEQGSASKVQSLEFKEVANAENCVTVCAHSLRAGLGLCQSIQ